MNKILDVKCVCGRITKVESGVTAVTCKCGKTYRLFKDGRGIFVGEIK